MYRALIVDDEPIAVDSIEYIINNNISSIEIVGKARSGRDAIEKAYITHPDIILMDINMPGINGLEALRQIKKETPDVRMIVTTAFDYFDYAVEAVNLNVVDYLLKPIKEEKLIETLKKVIVEIDIRRDRIRQEMELKEKFEMIVPILETGFINAVCMFNSNNEELNNYCRMFGFSEANGYILAIEFGEKNGGEIKNKIGIGIKSEKLYNDYRDILKSICKCVIGPVMLNRIIVYVFDKSSKGSFEQKNSAVKIAQSFYSRAEKIYPDISVGIGSCSAVDEVKKSYHEALHALQMLSRKSDCQILHFDDIIEETEDDVIDYEEQLESTIYASANIGNVTETIIAFDNIFTQITVDYMPDFDMVKNASIAIIVGFGKRWGNAVKNYCIVLSEIIKTNTINELHDICCKYIKEAVLQIASSKQKKINSVIEKANKYIEANFSMEISLDDIAKEVNLSPFYFSHFYKEETGASFIDSLITYRIEKAKEMLSKTEESIKEVSRSVGYVDPNYFSKLFKKIVGITASEYKEQNVGKI